MKRVQQKFRNDCSIAAVSMALRIPYYKVLKTAIVNDFIPNGPNGYDVARLLYLLDYECKFRAPLFGPRLIPIQGPFICSVPSLNHRKTNHAIVCHQGRIYDPSPKKKANWQYMMKNKRIIYFGFTKE